MNEQSILERLLSAQSALKTTIQKILDLNRQLKSQRVSRKAPESQDINQELKLLNKVAGQQARIVQLYESTLQRKVSN